MVSRLDEFLADTPTIKETDMATFNNLEKDILDMSIEEIGNFLYSKGFMFFYHKKRFIMVYLKWVISHDDNEKYIDLYNDIAQLKSDNIRNNFIFSVDEIVTIVNDAINIADETDIYGVSVYYICAWYGIKKEEYLSIRLSDVIDNKIYIPLTDRSIIIDSEKAMSLINEYMAMEEFVVDSERSRKYMGDTLFRNAPNYKMVSKNRMGILYNQTARFKKLISNKDVFIDTNIYNCGRYYAIYKKELEVNRELKAADIDIFEEIYGKRYSTQQIVKKLLAYRNFKKAYIEQNDQKLADNL